MRKTSKVSYRGRKNVQTINDDPSETVQSDAHLADINMIMKNFVDDGSSILDEAEMQFADVSDFGDYHDVMMEVRKAEETFLQLPSKVREIFDHSVEKWLDTAHDDDKRAKLVEAGVIRPVEKTDKEIPKEKTAAKGRSPSPEVAKKVGKKNSGSE